MSLSPSLYTNVAIQSRGTGYLTSNKLCATLYVVLKGIASKAHSNNVAATAED
jgi:hypothetical protein